MSEHYEEQYRKQLERAQTSKATVRAWFDVWARKPMVQIAQMKTRYIRSLSGTFWAGIGLISVVAALIYAYGWPVLLKLYAGVHDTSLTPGSEQFGRLSTQVAALIGGMIGFAFLAWRTWLTQRQTHIANETLYTQLLTKAVEQLGATREEKETRENRDRDGATKFETITKTVPNIEVRLGAIYALEKIAQDYLPLHWQVMEILCAYVRKNAGPARPAPDEIRAIWRKSPILRETKEEDKLKLHFASPRTDVQVALNVIGRRPLECQNFDNIISSRNLKRSLDLRGCHLSFADLDNYSFEDTYFDGSCLEGASFVGAYLEGASFKGAFTERAKFVRANLACADLSMMHFERVFFNKSFLCGANLSYSTVNESYFD